MPSTPMRRVNQNLGRPTAIGSAMLWMRSSRSACFAARSTSRAGFSGVIVSVANGLLDVETRNLIPHTPQFFNQTSVPFDYNERAGDPQRWLAFLKQLWPEDAAAIHLLGEWFGYVISGRLDLHKILLMVGPTRGGKGIIARILGALLGSRNVAGPTLNSLGGEFG